MGYTLTVDGVTVAPMRPGSVGSPIAGSKSQNGSDTLSFSLKQKTSGAAVPPFQSGDPVVLTEDSTGLKLFGGFVRKLGRTEVTDDPEGTFLITHTYHCVDHSAVARRRLVNHAWVNTAFETIVSEMVAAWLGGEGITVVNVAAGPTIVRAPFSWRPVADAFDELAEMVGYSWWIDEDKDLHFVPRGTDTASLSFSSTSRDFIKMNFAESLEEYVNQVVQIGGLSLTDTLTETLIGDGTRKVFNVAFTVGKKPISIVAGGITILADEIGINGLDTGKKWYWQKGNAEFEQDETETILTDAQTLVIQYVGQFPVITQAEDTVEIVARAAASPGTSGRYEKLLVDASLDDIDIATEKALGYLRKYGEIPETIKFSTRNQTLRPGQLMSIVLPELDIDGDYLVDTISYRDFGDDTFVYSVTVLSGESFGGWQAFWRRLVREENLILGDDFVVDLIQLNTTVEVVLTETAIEDLFPLHTVDITTWGLASVANQGFLVTGEAQIDVSSFNTAGAGIAD